MKEALLRAEGAAVAPSLTSRPAEALRQAPAPAAPRTFVARQQERCTRPMRPIAAIASKRTPSA